jgi:hypothetical protein
VDAQTFAWRVHHLYPSPTSILGGFYLHHTVCQVWCQWGIGTILDRESGTL